MSLTKPFFNTIPAIVPLNDDQVIQFNVLGGDRITKYTYRIYEASSGQQVPVDDLGNIELTIDVTDSAPLDEIRTFDIAIKLPTNYANYSYKIIVYTENETETSVESEAQLFSVYFEPSLVLYVNDGNSMVSLGNSYTFSSTSLKVYPYFSPNSSGSIAQFNKGVITLRGFIDNYNYIDIGTYPIYQRNVSLTVPTANSPYIEINDFDTVTSTISKFRSYQIIVDWETVDGYKPFQPRTYFGIRSEFNLEKSSASIQLNNVCDSGIIEVSAEYGTVGLTDYELQYREDTGYKWVTFFNSSNSGIKINFPFCRNGATYYFRIVLLGANGLVTESYYNSVESSFKRSCICDATHLYNLINEWSVGQYSVSNINTTYEPFNSKYPVLIKNAKNKYRSGTYTAVLLSENSNIGTSELNNEEQAQLKKEFNQWLSNGHAKVIKTTSGEIRLVKILSNVENSFYQELGNNLASTTFNWVEIGDIHNDSLKFDLWNFGKLVLNNYSWEEINEIAQRGEASQYFFVGDKKNVTLSNGEVVTLVILGFNQDDLTSGGKSPISFGMENLLKSTYFMNPTDTIAGGWSASIMRTVTLPNILSIMPSDLKSIIKMVNKKTVNEDHSQIVISNDYLWLFSYSEILGRLFPSTPDEGDQYQYWITAKPSLIATNRIKYLSNGTSSASWYWMREPLRVNESFYAVNTVGGMTDRNASAYCGVCFGFCI